MKIALECPSDLLDEVQPLADFDFALTHLVLSDERYAKWYRDSKRFKILDNSTNELLQPCTLEDIEKAADIIKTDLIVPPDFLGNHFATEKSLDEAIKVFGKEKLLPVVQGHELRYTIESSGYIVELGFSKLAVPYDILSSRTDDVTVMATNRQRVVNEIISRVSIGFEIHLLGMTTLEELQYCSKGPWVKSIDTGSPILHGMYGSLFGRDELLPKDIPTLDRIEVAPAINLDKIYYNICYLRKVCNAR